MDVTDYEYEGHSNGNFHLFRRIDGSDRDWIVIVDRGGIYANHRYGGVLGSKDTERIRSLTQKEVAQFRMLAFPDII